MRIDKWLWYARFFRTRAAAVEAVAKGVRVNGNRVTKSAYAVSPGDVLTLVQAGHVRTIRVLGCGERRGPAPEAALLYADMDTATPPCEPQ